MSMDYFYLKPLPKVPADFNDPWFECMPIGKNTLGKFMQSICQDANIDRRKESQPQLASNGL